MSQQVRRLERELGVALFERTTRQVRLTRVGREVYEQVSRLLVQSTRTEEYIRQLAAGGSGRLTVGFVPSAAYDLLPRIVAPFGQENPDVELVLREAPTSEQLRKIVDGDLDVGLVRDVGTAPGIRLVRLVREPLVLACPKDHPAAATRRVRLASLVGDRFIVLPSAAAPAMYSVVEGLARPLGSTCPRLARPSRSRPHSGWSPAAWASRSCPTPCAPTTRPAFAYRPIVDTGAVSVLSAAVASHRDDPLVDRLLSTAVAAG